MAQNNKTMILIIDDERIIRDSLRNQLEDWDYKVLEAENGRKGLEIFKEKSPSMVLLDLRMPEMDGLDVLSHITEHYPETPIVVISGAGVIGDVVQALRLGAWDYILKPIEDMSVLEHAINKSFERVKLINDNRNYQEHLEDEIRKRTIELEKTNESLKFSEERYKLLADNLKDFIWSLDMTLMPLYISPSVMSLRGYLPEEAITHDLKKTLTPESLKKAYEIFASEREKINNGSFIPKTIEMEFKCKDGSTVLTESVISIVYDDKKKPVQIIGVTRDIAERKEAEEKIKASLKEKETLLKEIHHRVKNNMQIISSLLDLQSNNIVHERDKVLFHDSQNRVRSMALVHEKLYQSENLSEINFGEYIQGLSDELYSIYYETNQNVNITINAENAYIDINYAIPCGLIINELVTNSLKYAFPDNMKGIIKIDFYEEKGNYVLQHMDDGVGIPENIDINDTATLGLQLVNNLTLQLRGTIDIDSSQGTNVKIKFGKFTEY
ncbi:sensor histidine kinase [Spirochaetota bacterium]